MFVAVVVGVLVLYGGGAEAAFDADVPEVEESSIHVENLVQRENESWTLDLNVTWDRPNGTRLEGYMVKLTERFSYSRPHDDPLDYDLPIGGFDWLFPDSFSPPTVSLTDREKLEQRGYSFTDAESFAYDDVRLSHDYEFEVIVLLDGNSGRGVKHMFLTADCYSSTGDREFCENQPVVLSSEPVNMTLLGLSCQNSTEGASFTAVVSWLRPVQVAQAHSIIRYVIRLEQGDSVAEGAQFDQFVVENSTRDPLDPVYFKIQQLKLGESYELHVTPLLNMSHHDYPTPYGNKGRLTFNTTSTDRCAWLHGGKAWKDDRSASEGSSVLVSVLPALSVVTVVVLVGSAVAFCLCRRHRDGSKTYTGLTFFPLMPKSDWKPPVVPRPQHDFGQWELSRGLLDVEKEPIGKGAFGLVFRAIAVGLDKNPLPVTVAVKTLPDHPTNEQRQDFLDEIQTILDIGPHPNILGMRGCCTMSDPLYIVVEYMPYGDLLHFLWGCRQPAAQKEDPIYQFQEKGVYQVARQVARGMEYLSQKRFIHGDLAARNVLVGDGLVVKISDFGLSSDIYHRGYMRENMGRKIPLKWVSPERIYGGGRCTIKSDVWSFGVLLYELVTLGGVPYPGMTMRQIMEKLKNGYRMERPDDCSILLYDVMKRCWKWKPVERPSFSDLFNEFDAILNFDADYTRVLQAIPMGDERDYSRDIGADDDVTMSKEEDVGSVHSDVTDEEEKEEQKDEVAIETETSYLPMAERKRRCIISKTPAEDKDSGYCGDMTSSPHKNTAVRYENDVTSVEEEDT
ncbi:FGFR3 [Branchiostoma lanceolatum]|uniref:FGFR3 protein n=2 Tax=Branchiostoma lanceolatum TaxID=7740 RepID=A0A8J9ZG33_BRALA|nr:FGFR3 [Branchiostoma lanceolatum]